MKTTLAWLLTAALLVGAWLIAASAPADDAYIDPFPVAAEIDQPADGVTFATTVRDVRAASTVTGAGGWTADGTWIVVYLDAEGAQPRMSYSPVASSLGLAELTISGRTYGASERAPSLLAQRLGSGVSSSGVLFFEVPEDALAGTGILRLAGSSDTRGLAVVTFEIPLDDLELESEIELPVTDWTNP